MSCHNIYSCLIMLHMIVRVPISRISRYWKVFIFCRLKINHDSYEFILELSTIANKNSSWMHLSIQVCKHISHLDICMQSSKHFWKLVFSNHRSRYFTSTGESKFAAEATRHPVTGAWYSTLIRKGFCVAQYIGFETDKVFQSQNKILSIQNDFFTKNFLTQYFNLSINKYSIDNSTSSWEWYLLYIIIKIGFKDAEWWWCL
jgi:hypothetical protein